MKCDEIKPKCHRCSRFGRRCEGYADSVSLVQVHLLQPASLRFRNEGEHRYFGLFREAVAPCLSIYFNSGLWDRLLPQACDSHQPTQYAVVAIGALKRTYDLKELPDGRSSRRLEEARFHYKFALRQYGNAVRLMQRDSIDSIHDLRIVLVNSIAIICFEALHGDYDAALRQVIVGLRLLQDYHRGASYTCQTSPDFEEELIRAFGRLSKQSVALNASLSSDGYRDPKNLEQPGLGIIASNPQILDQARIHLKQTTQQRLAYMASISPAQVMNCVTFDISTCIPKELNPLGEQNPCSAAYRAPVKESIFDAMALEVLCQEIRFEPVDSNQTCADLSKFMPLFAQIILTARQTLRSPRLSPKCGPNNLEMQAILPLHTVIKHCPDVNLRNEAMELLLLSKERKDYVDNFQSGTLGEWVRVMAVAKWVDQQ